MKYYLVHQLGFTNKEASKAILSGKLVINGQSITENVEFDEHCEIYYQNQLLKPRTAFTYIACYKPRGIETTFNPEIPDNLGTIFKFNEHLGYIGRLDKESEGLLLLTNDGKYIQKLSNPLFEKEKEYLVNNCFKKSKRYTDLLVYLFLFKTRLHYLLSSYLMQAITPLP